MNGRKTLEPLWWGLFSAGGVVAAFLVPIHIIITGIAVPLGWLPDAQEIYRHWLVRLYLFILIALPLYLWAHRFQFALSDMGMRGIHKPLAVLCYGAALLGTVIAGWILLRL